MKDVKKIYSLLLNSNGLKIIEIAHILNMDKSYVANILFSDKCISYWYQNDAFLWFAKEGSLNITTQVQYSLPRSVTTKKAILIRNRNLINNQIESSRFYIHGFYKYHNYSKEETEVLFRRYRKGDTSAYDLLLLGNLRRIPTIAKSCRGRGVPFEDLLQEGVLGLIKAIKHFKSKSTKYTFNEYSSYWIWQAVTSSCAELSYIIRLPSNIFYSHKKLIRSIERFESMNGYRPQKENTGTNLEYETLSCLYNLPEDLNEIICYYNDWDSVEDSTFPVDENLEHADLHSLIKWILSYLSLREQDILKRYYGIDCEHEYSLEDIGKKHDLTRERVRQIKEKALNRLRGVFLKKKRTIYSLFGFYLGTKKGSYKNKNNNTSSTEYSNKDIRNNYLSAQNNATDNSPHYYILTTELNQTFIENGCRFPITSNKLIQLITNCDATENVTFNVPIQINEKKFYTQMRYCCFSNSDQNHFELDWKVQSHIQDILSELKNNHNYTVVEIYADKENRFIIKPVSRKK